MKTSNLLLTAV